MSDNNLFKRMKSNWIFLLSGIGTALALQSPAAAIVLDLTYTNALDSTLEGGAAVRPPAIILQEEGSNFDLFGQGGQIDAPLVELGMEGVKAPLTEVPAVVTPTPVAPPPMEPVLIAPGEAYTQTVEIPDAQLDTLESLSIAAPIVEATPDGFNGTGQFIAAEEAILLPDMMADFEPIMQTISSSQVFAVGGEDNGTAVPVFADESPAPVFSVQIAQADSGQAVPGPSAVVGLAAIAGAAGFLKVKQRQASNS